MSNATDKPARVLQPWEAHTLTLGNMQTLLSIYRHEQRIDGRSVRPLIARGLARWSEGKLSKATLTDRGHELAKTLEHLAKIEAPRHLPKNLATPIPLIEERAKRAAGVLEEGLEYHKFDGHNMPKSVARNALSALTGRPATDFVR